jgi:hypothetical protein
MQARFLISAGLALLLAACTIEQRGTEIESEFHPPFTYQTWASDRLASANGHAACTVSSGYNGLTFVVRKTATGSVVSVQSNRYMRPGTWITVNVNGHRYETSQPYFSAQDAPLLAKDFSAGDKAYVEWSELRATNGRTRHSAIYKLNGFKQKFEACRTSTSSPARR